MLRQIALIAWFCTAALPAFALEAGALEAGTLETAAPALVSACFVPQRACVGAIAGAIDAARRTVRVQAYGFTSAPILAALLRAKARGVDVRLLLDKVNDWGGRQETRSGAGAAEAAGIPVAIDDRPAIAHSKVIVIDGRLVIGGSYNYTASAERRNAENVLFIESPAVAGWFAANWRARQAVSRPMVQPARNTQPAWVADAVWARFSGESAKLCSTEARSAPAFSCPAQ